MHLSELYFISEWGGGRAGETSGIGDQVDDELSRGGQGRKE